MLRMKMLRRSMQSLQQVSNSIENAWDPLKSPTTQHVLSDNNKTVQRTAGATWVTGYAATRMPGDRKSAWEVVMGGAGAGHVIGFTGLDGISSTTAGYPGQGSLSGSLYWGRNQTGQIFVGANVAASVGTLGRSGEFSIGEVVGFLHDPVAGKVYLCKNGLPMNGGAAVWTIPPGKLLLPAYAVYSSPAKNTLRSGAGALKYKYEGYSTASDGGIAPGQGIDFFDAVNKHANLYVIDYGRTAIVNTAIGVSHTSFATRVLPSTKKSVFEFIYANKAAFAVCGMYFGADRSGPKSTILGQTQVSSLGIDFFSAGGGTVRGNGCTVALANIGTSLENDTYAFGFDPVAKTVVMWKNGVPLNSGNPIWTNVNSLHADGGILPGISVNPVNACIRLNPDAYTYNYGDYTA